MKFKTHTLRDGVGSKVISNQMLIFKALDHKDEF